MGSRAGDQHLGLRGAVWALTLRTSHQLCLGKSFSLPNGQSALGQVSLLPLEVSKQSPSDHFRRKFWRLLRGEVTLSDLVGLFDSSCHITETACAPNQVQEPESTCRGQVGPSGPAVTLCYQPACTEGMFRGWLAFSRPGLSVCIDSHSRGSSPGCATLSELRVFAGLTGAF